jgi:hypothetical protein
VKEEIDGDYNETVKKDKDDKIYEDSLPLLEGKSITALEWGADNRSVQSFGSLSIVLIR